MEPRRVSDIISFNLFKFLKSGAVTPMQVHFSALQTLLVAGIVLFAVAIPLWALWHAGRSVPPALECRGRASGFGGGLVVFLAPLVFFALLWILMTAVDAARAWRFMHMSDLPAAQLFAPLVPDVLFAALFSFISVRLALSRKPRVPAEAASLIWVLGPVSTLAGSLFYKTPVAWETLAAGTAFALASTLYLTLSDRVALTYGTSRGKSLTVRESNETPC